MTQLKVESLLSGGPYVVERNPILDDRGFFERLFCEGLLADVMAGKSISQINHSYTVIKGTVRGLHFQYSPNAEIKMITCMKGKVWDVAVDIRKGSPTFLNHFGIILSQENLKSFIIPEGFAHGFQSLEPDSELLYFHSQKFCASSEGRINALDPKLSIRWPERITIRSQKDSECPFLHNDFLGI